MERSGRDPHTSEGGVVVLNGWTKEEKLELFVALKGYGSKNVDQIQAEISSKTTDQIKAAINAYKKKGIKLNKHKEKFKKKQRKTTFNPRIPLASWAKFLMNSLGYKELQTETSAAIRLIADLEKIPSPLITENINFSQIYHQIANALEGKSMVEDYMTYTILKKCILETALISKTFMKNSVYKFVMNSLNISDRERNLFPQPTDDFQLGLLRDLTSQRNYNPLNIPENVLSPLMSREYQ